MSKKDTPMHKSAGEATLILPDGNKISLPVYAGTRGPQVIDVRSLVKHGYFTYDPGFMATASCSSNITYIDGERGELLYRGYLIEDLCRRNKFLDTAYLLLNGELPSLAQRRVFIRRLRYHTMVTERIADFIRGFESNAHPMAVLISLIGALSAFYHETIDLTCAESRNDTCLRMIAKVPTLAAMSYKYSIGQPIIHPQNKLRFVENFIYMMFATPCEEYKVDPVLADALESILILHADHEQNASTSTVRLVGSSSANPFACVSAGVASLWGPAHGGANEQVLQMLESIGDASKIGAYIDTVKGESGLRLAGFGHRVYKNFDPRSSIMRKICHKVLKHLKLEHDSIFQIALDIEQIALSDEYFIERKLYPNVDFYSGIVLRAIGIPVQMFTAIFAIARTVGWVAQWRELHEDPEFRIGRPRQLYEGSLARRIKPAGKKK